METENKYVDFEKYCEKCKHKVLKEFKDPCNECLEQGARIGTEKPLNYEEAIGSIGMVLGSNE